MDLIGHGGGVVNAVHHGINNTLEKKMSDNEPKRELNWWEHYPLHKLWCNDACPLVPRFEYRKGDEWNADNWSLHWLIFNIWTLEHFAFGLDAEVDPQGIYVGAILPYLRVIVTMTGNTN
jgi:hypothetical protein